jgi:hypothetical protein
MAIKKTVITKYTHLKKAFLAGELSMEEVKTIRLNDLKDWQTGSTSKRIYSYMPSGKQTNWREFMKLHETVLKDETLTPLNQVIYDTFPNNNDTKQQAYDKCIKVFNWIMQCIADTNEKERQIEETSTVAEILAVPDPQYKPWPLK